MPQKLGKFFFRTCAKTLEPLLSFITRPTLKYVGFALLLGWHYGLWFVPHMFSHIALLDERVTVSWLINLGSTVIFLLLFALVLGRKRHLSSYLWLYIMTPVLTCFETLALCLLPQSFTQPNIAYVLSFLLGASESVMWILWGERYACVKANFSVRHIGTTFGLTLMITISIAWILPPYTTTFFTTALPLLSAILLIVARHDKKRAFPVLLPKSKAQGGFRNMLTVSAIVLPASMACYFLVSLAGHSLVSDTTTWNLLSVRDQIFTFGIMGGSFIMLTIAGISALSKDKANVFKMLPWLLVLEIVAFGLFLADSTLYFAAFVIVTGVSSLLEILLIMYFGILTSKGYVTPALAFACAGAFVRAGIVVGNTWAVGYERTSALTSPLAPETCLGFICLLAILLIPLVKQEFNIQALTAAPPNQAEIDEICTEVSKEFCLSCREGEILGLIAHGYTANSMAQKLIISPYTVNTHIRHIYEKMQIHKRSELLNYLNMQRSDF